MDQSIQDNKLVLLGKLAASLSHEIRNPLSAIKLSLQYLRTGERISENDFNETIDTSLEAAERIEFLTQSILEFSRKNTENAEASDVCNIAEKAYIIVEGTAKKKSLTLYKSFADSIPKLHVNPNKILQVLLNLLTNAIDATHHGGRVEIKLRSHEGNVVIEVTDSGIGIAAEDQQRIFEDFFTKKKHGTGLGLGVCRNILKEYNGEISFHSEVNKGTTFLVTLPVSKV